MGGNSNLPYLFTNPCNDLLVPLLLLENKRQTPLGNESMLDHHLMNQPFFWEYNFLGKCFYVLVVDVNAEAYIIAAPPLMTKDLTMSSF